jgi:hypothetical protein
LFRPFPGKDRREKMKEEAQDFTAIFSRHISQRFVFRVPKKNGRGYLKSCFGGHHNSNTYFEWEPPEKADLEADIDGYTVLSLRLNWWDEGYDELLKEIRSSIEQVYPRITGWREVDFMELVEM